MQEQKQFDNIIKKYLNEKAEEIELKGNTFESIIKKLDLNGSDIKMPSSGKKLLHLNSRKSIAIASCLVILISGSVIVGASGMAKGYLSDKSYSPSESNEQISKDAGFQVKMPSSLPGNFKLVDKSTAKYVDDTNPSNKDNKKEVGGIYRNGSDKDKFIGLDIANDRSVSTIFKNGSNINIGDKVGIFAQYNQHIVSPDYKFTKQDEEDAKEGKVDFITVGSRTKKQIVNRLVLTHALRWEDNNIGYSITDSGNGLSKDEMIKIAESIINSK